MRPSIRRIPSIHALRSMIDRDFQETADAGKTEGQPKRSRLGQILAERPEARPRLGNAVGSLLATFLVALAACGLLLIWHLRRRAQLIRDHLAPSRDVSLSDFSLDDDDESPPGPGVPDATAR